VIAREAHAYARYGRLTVEAVRDGCTQALEHGHAVNEALIIPGLAAVGVGIHGGGGLLGAISVADTVAALAPPHRTAVADALRRVVLAAGYSPDPGAPMPLRLAAGVR
jgi:DNA-binding IclR family transcriptional regulator